VSGCTRTTQQVMLRRPDRLGVLLTPANGNREWWDETVAWACDNDCFKGLNAPAYLRMLARVVGFRTRPAFVPCPDVVADAGKTWDGYDAWVPVLRSLGLPVALVLQDGIERLRWGARLPHAMRFELAAVFVGGSTAWKLGDHAARLSLEAHAAGLHVHWGRVNTLRRIVYIARRMRDGQAWCDTIDGTGFSSYGDKRIPKAVEWIDRALADRQRVMFGGQA
jgi:hypothetical protein